MGQRIFRVDDVVNIGFMIKAKALITKKLYIREEEILHPYR